MLYHIDSHTGLRVLEEESVTLAITSPPYANTRKSYEGVKPSEYVNWFLPITDEILRVLKPEGSFVLNIKDKCEKGERIPYTHELVYKMRLRGWKLIETYIWVKTKGLPCVSSRRGADYFEYIYHFAKTTKPIFNVDEWRTPYPESSLKRAQYTIKENTSNREARLEKGEKAQKKWNLHPKGAWPKNVLYFPLDQGKDHPAAFNIALPDYFIRCLTNPGDTVLDPFCGRGTSCSAANKLGREYVGFDSKEEFLEIGVERYGLLRPSTKSKCDAR
jgi:site-specific DNA-methyltransferase (adenine-specific)